MPRLITLSRAARLVGVKRGVLQKKIQEGELHTFEGEIILTELLQAYPQTRVEDTTMLERVEQIMEQAVNKVIQVPHHATDASTLAARVLGLGQELAKARHEARRYARLIEELKKKFREFSPDGDNTQAQAFSKLADWFRQALNATEAADNGIDEIIAKEAFLRVMAAQVRILPSGHEFFIEGSDSILEAGLRGGLALDYGCSNGNCGQCKARLVSGQVRKVAPHDYVLTEVEKELGYILTCSNTAVTDVALEADEALGSNDIPAQEIDIRVKKIEQPDQHVLIVNAKTPRTRRLRFLAGQYLALVVDGLPAQDCSIASCPCDDMNLQFHIPVIPGNPFVEQLAGNTRPNDVITINGPQGDFTLDEDSPRSLLFIACNAGFAPVKSLIEHAMALDSAEEIYLLWITTPDNTHYQGNLCRSWDDALDNFHYAALQTDSEAAVTGLLPEALAAIDGLDNFDCYACVPSPLLDPLQSTLQRLGLPPSQLHMEPVR